MCLCPWVKGVIILTVCETYDGLYEEATAVCNWLLECGWEVLSGVYHRIFAVFLLLKKVAECYSFREECAFKGD